VNWRIKLIPNFVNVISLTAIQGANALFPLLVFPFLINVLGKDSFAKLVTTESIALYLLAISLYSFDTVGLQWIIESRRNSDKKSEASYFFNILGARLITFIISGSLIFVFYVWMGGKDYEVLLAWYAFVLGTILQNNYYFQARGNNLTLALCVVISRSISIALIYYNIDDSEDLVTAASIIGCSFLVSGLAAYITLSKYFATTGLELLDIKVMKSILRNGKYLFIGNLSVGLFRSSNVLILASVTTSASVASYALAEKIIKSIQALTRPLNQFFETNIIKEWSDKPIQEKNHLCALRLICKNTKNQIYLMLLVVTICIGALNYYKTRELFGGFDREAILLITIMSPSIIFGTANSMFGVVGLNLINKQYYFARVVFVVGIGILMFSIIFSNKFGSFGAASSFLFAEIFLLFGFLIGFLKK
jgi:PST family polysaccharide transporter